MKILVCIILMFPAFTFGQNGEYKKSKLYTKRGHLRVDKTLKLSSKSTVLDWSEVESKLIDYLSKSVKYPEALFRSKLMGLTITKVEMLGSKISVIKVVRSIGGGSDEALELAIKNIPNEILEKLNTEKNKKLVFYLPICFTLYKMNRTDMIKIFRK